MLRANNDCGTLYFCEPIEVIADDVTATSIPLSVPAWQPDVWYPAGAMVSVGSRTFLSALTEAASYVQDCPHLYNLNRNPTDVPPPYVPYGDTDDQYPCDYLQAGKAWWAEIDPAIDYVTAMLNPNIYSGAEVQGTLSVTVAPKAPYDAVGVFGLRAATATLSNGDSRDLALFPATDSSSEPENPLCRGSVRITDLGPRCTHADRVVWLLDAPTTASFTLTLTPLNGVCQAGTLVIARTNILGVTNFQTTIGIVDYSRKERDLAGRVQLVPRWYQDHVRYLLTVPAETRRLVHDVLIRLRNTPCLVVGHENPKRYEMQVFGLLKDVALPLENAAQSIIDVEIESVGVPRLISGIPVAAIPDPPPKPDFSIGAPWLAVGHDEDPYVTVVDTITWQKVRVSFTIPGPARAVLFSPDSAYLYLGHECPPYFTIVRTSDWTALLDPGTDGSSSGCSSDSTPYGDLGTVVGLSQSPSGSRLALAHQCPPYLTVLSVPDWQHINGAMPLPSRSMVRTAFSLDGGTLLATDSCYYRWWLSTSDYAELHPINGRGRAGIFYWDGQHALLGYSEDGLFSSEESSESASFGNRVALVSLADWDTPTYTVKLPGEPYIIKYTRDHKYVAIGHRCPPYVTIIDAATGALVETFFTLEYSVCSLDFTFDDLYMAAVYKHHPYCTIIKTVNWTEFYLAFDDLDLESST